MPTYLQGFPKPTATAVFYNAGSYNDFERYSGETTYTQFLACDIPSNAVRVILTISAGFRTGSGDTRALYDGVEKCSCDAGYIGMTSVDIPAAGGGTGIATFEGRSGGGGTSTHCGRADYTTGA